MEEDFTKGDILKANDRAKGKGVHYIVFIRGNTKSDFVGVMLTGSDKWVDNCSMTREDFFERDIDGNPYKIIYSNSLFVKQYLIKPPTWGPYDKVGQLTDEGIRRIEETITDGILLDCETYLQKQKKI